MLWKKVMPQLSPAGCSRSLSASWWPASASGSRSAPPGTGTSRPCSRRSAPMSRASGTGRPPPTFPRSLPRSSVDGRRVAQGRDSHPLAKLKSEDAPDLDGEAAAGSPTGSRWHCSRCPRWSAADRRSPYVPFRTTTLQQEASRKLGLLLQMTRCRSPSGSTRTATSPIPAWTDSTTLSQTAIDAAAPRPASRYGADYVPDAPRLYTSKVKSAQEAHEAIRPAATGSARRPRPGCPATSSACTSWCGSVLLARR